MMGVLTYIGLLLICVGSTYALWIFYIAVMGLKRARDDKKLTATAKVLGYPVLVVGLLLDFFVNVIPMSILLLELPQETTVTSRLKRHNRSVRFVGLWGAPPFDRLTVWYNNKLMPYRKAVAAWAEPLLDPFDPTGDHI